MCSTPVGRFSRTCHSLLIGWKELLKDELGEPGTETREP